MGHVSCSSCGERVSNIVSEELLVRAYIECPECIEKKPESAIDETNLNAVLADVLAEIQEGAWTDNNTGEKYVYIEQLKGFLGKYFS